MQVYPNRFSQQLNQPLQPFYLVFGDEPQQKLEVMALLRSAAKDQGFDERQSLVADNQFNWNSLLEATQSMSLFADKQLIELELPTGKPGTEGSKILTGLAESGSPDTLMIIHGPRVGKDVQNTKWFKQLDKLGVFVPCFPLEGRPLHQWISQRFRDAGLQADAACSQIVADFCEGNLLAAKQEIDKLALLFPNAALSPQQIEASVVDQSRFNVFQLIDVMLSGEAQRAIKILYRLESEGIEPTIVLWALVREWQTLSSLQQKQQQGQSINWNQFRIWKNRQGFYQSALQRLSASQLNHIQDKLTVLDHALKQSQVTRPFIELCHIIMLFLALPLDKLALSHD